MMTVLFVFGLCIVFILFLEGVLKLQPRNSRGHMINAGWLESSERFKLITRWGAQH